MDTPPPHMPNRSLKLLCGHTIYGLWLVYLVLALWGFYGIRPLDRRYWTAMLLLVLFIIVSQRLAAAYLSKRR
jgi:hypothetical protein